jgi:hypothetical protein
MSKPFEPIADTTVALSATTASGATRAALLGRPASGKFQIRMFNEGPNTARIRFGGADATAVATNYPLPAGAVEVITLDASLVTHVAAITATGTAAVSFTTGDGI